jgi:hypothetical protein
VGREGETPPVGRDAGGRAALEESGSERVPNPEELRKPDSDPQELQDPDEVELEMFLQVLPGR